MVMSSSSVMTSILSIHAVDIAVIRTSVLFIFSVSVVMSSSPVVIFLHTAVTVEIVVISSFMFASRRFGCSKMVTSSRIFGNLWSVSLSFFATWRLGCSNIGNSSLIRGDHWSLFFISLPLVDLVDQK